jgi:hypothetical protein
VTSRLADERLWAEALNLGAWDVLAKPFDADEVIRIGKIAGPNIWLQLEHSPGGRNQMDTIILTDEELRRLEKRFGPAVRQMGPWNSDGVLGYASIPIAAVEKAAETLENRSLRLALPRLRTSGRTKTLVELLEDFGPVLVERIIDANRELSLRPQQAVLVSSANPF